MFNDAIKINGVMAAALAIVVILDSPVQAQVMKADFNGDGYGDLAIGSPGESGRATGSGLVHVLYGTSAFGLHAYGNEILFPWRNDVPFGSYLGRFGSALAWGDFNNDGFTDLSVGMPGFALSNDGWGERGAVRVYYGKQYGGLDDAPGHLFIGDHQEDLFGTSLAVGNFNGDEYMDLAIGVPQGHPFYVPHDNLGGGEILVLYGGKSGLSLVGADRRSQASVGFPGSPEYLDTFGFALAAGDFGFGPEDDLAIGVPGENNGEGAVNIVYGSPTGLVHTGAQLFQQGSYGLAGSREVADRFGFSLAAGDFNLNGYADLAIGSPTEDIGTLTDTGLVHIVYGGLNGLDPYLTQAFGQDWGDLNLQGGATAGDYFGWSLAAGDFGKDSAADLAIGVPGDDVNGTATGGAVNVVYGSFLTRLVQVGNQRWAQTNMGSGDLLGVTEDGDRFGYSLGALDVGGTSRMDLVIGVPGESVSGQLEAGAVNVILSTTAGLSSTGNQVWTQDSVSQSIAVQGVAERGDHFGYSVGGGDSSLDTLLPQ